MSPASPKQAAKLYGNGYQSRSGTASAALPAPSSAPTVFETPMNRPRSRPGTTRAMTSSHGATASPPNSVWEKQATYTTATISQGGALKEARAQRASTSDG